MRPLPAHYRVLLRNERAPRIPEELVTVLVVYLPELLPLGAFDLLVSVLPKLVP